MALLAESIGASSCLRLLMVVSRMGFLMSCAGSAERSWPCHMVM